jgi:hypothetical protein
MKLRGHTDNIRALLLDSTGRLVEWGLQLLSFVCMRFFFVKKYICLFFSLCCMARKINKCPPFPIPIPTQKKISSIGIMMFTCCMHLHFLWMWSKQLFMKTCTNDFCFLIVQGVCGACIFPTRALFCSKFNWTALQFCIFFLITRFPIYFWRYCLSGSSDSMIRWIFYSLLLFTLIHPSSIHHFNHKNV